MKEIILYKSPDRTMKLVLLCSILIVLGLLGIFIVDVPFEISFLYMGFFGLGCPLLLYHSFDRRPQIIINENGIFAREADTDHIYWEIIQDTYLTDNHRQKSLCLIVDGKSQPLPNESELYQQILKNNEATEAQKLNIPLSQIDVDPDWLIEFVSLMRAASKSEKVELIGKVWQKWEDNKNL